MVEILDSAVLGNVIGILSLVVGIIGLIMTIYTLNVAKKIEAEVKSKQIEAVEKVKFNERKKQYISKLKQQRNAVLETRKISMSICEKTISICNDIKNHTGILSEKNTNDIVRCIADCTRIRNDKIKIDTDEYMTIYDNDVALVIGILERGEFDL